MITNFIKSDIFLPVSRDKTSNVFPVTEKNDFIIYFLSSGKLCENFIIKRNPFPSTNLPFSDARQKISIY